MIVFAWNICFMLDLQYSIFINAYMLRFLNFEFFLDMLEVKS